MFSNPIAAYKQVDLESDIRGSDPHRLIILLFDAAEKALSQAQEHLAARNIVGKTESITKAIEIILEGLVASLDIERGGELADKLHALYMYMVSRLVHANINMDAAAVSEVQGLLAEISGAWKEMRKTLDKGQNPEQPTP